ncbi:type II toxin-antitoxin system VapC family toxin [Deinococcus antarcticus]|uniref:Ribonuclease VapC n=1 Tax=Deinococcus antarcticus TaxID=1298767 RepID=A0ABV8A2I3_9DEIO
MMYLLDTNVISEESRRVPDPGVAAWFAAQTVDHSFLSIVTLAEVEQGILRLGKTKRAAELTEFLLFVEAEYQGRILPIDRPVARTWSEITARAFRAGQPLGYADSWIAATALTHRLTVVTRNVADFQAAGVGIFNPWESP